MVVVADASVAIRGDLSGYESDLKRAEATTGGFAGRIKNILSPRNVIGAAGLLGIGLGVRQLVGYAGDAADQFSGLQQTMRTTDEVFGDSAGVIEEWATRAADAAGMSQRTVFQSGSVMGQTLINMGFSAEEAADKVVMLQQRASEMAIAFGQTPERAILAITAAMRGERDTIEKFGVSIKQVDVNARVAELGLSAATGEAKKNAEAMAILDLVMEQTAAQAGRFGESQDDVAVKMAQANAKIDDFMTTQVGPAVASIQLGAVKVGEAFVGAADGVGMFFDNVFNPEKQAKVEMLAEVTGRSFNEMRDEIQRGANEAGVTWEAQLDFLVSATENSASEMEESSRRIPRGVARSLEAGAEEVGLAAEFGIKDPILEEMLAAEENAGKSGLQVVIEYAKGLLTPQTDVEIAIQTALQVVEDEMSIVEELAYLSGQKTVLEEARGIASQEGKDASVIAIDAALKVIEDRMQTLSEDAYDYGYNTAAEFARGLTAGRGLVVDPARRLATSVSAPIAIESEPKDHSSPLYGITKWGGNIAKTLAEGMVGQLGTASAASAALAGALSPSFGSAGAMGGGMGAGSVTYNYNLIVDGLPITVGGRQDVLDGWDRLAREKA